MTLPMCTVVLCQECTMAIENGDTSGNSEEWRIAYHANNKVWLDITIGHYCNEDPNCFHMGESCEDDCNCSVTQFSSKACYLCDTQLAGYRHDYTAWG